ncbi:M42 family peptidase, partial [bacterium]
MDLPLLRELVESHGIAGYEASPRSIAEREMSKLGETRTDRLGNLHLHLAGEGPKVMIAAHLDEIGFLVRFVDEDGFLFLQPLGGFDPRQMNSKRVRVTTDTETLAGTLNYGTKPKHLLSDDEAKAGQKIESFFVD